MIETISILLAGEFPTEHSELRTVLAATPHFSILGEVKGCLDLLAKVEELNPQLLILDVDLTGGNIFETMATMRQRAPQTRILVMTRQNNDAAVFAAIKAGALGYVLISDINQLSLIQSIEDVARGESALSPMIARKLIRELHRPASLPPNEEPLTDQEVASLIFLTRGFSNLEISETLEISERTVRTLISNILSKLHLENRTQATLYDLTNSQIKIPDMSLHFKRIEGICHQLRGTLQGLLEEEKAFFVNGKPYAVYLYTNQADRHVILLIPVPHGIQEQLINSAPHKFLRASRYATQGWIGIDLAQLDDEELRYYLHQAWRLVSP